MAREVARRTLRRIEREEAFASVALSEEIERARLSDADRGLATELVYGVLRHRTRIDRALVAATKRGRLDASAKLRVVLRVAGYQLLFLDRVPAHAVVDDAVAAAKRIGGPRMGGFVNGLLRALARDGEPALPVDPIERAEVEQSLPRWIVERIAAAVGPVELAAAAAGINAPAPLAIRVCDPARRDEVAELLRAERDAVAVESVEDLPEALRVSGLGDPSASRSFRDGLWTVQDIGAQRVSRLVAPVPGQHVLDACSGLGGKAAHLVALAGGDISIDAADRSERKLAQLREHAARMGIASIRTIAADLTDPQAPLAERYDAVLLDAPCTGLGVLRRHPEAKWRVTESDVVAMAELQARLLDALAPRAAGALVYAVCTFTAEEGADQVAAFVGRHPEFRLERELSTWPHRDGADAFYAARLARVP